MTADSGKANDAVDACFERIHRAALVLTGNPWDADDLTQETFLIYSRQADAFAGRSSVYTYLYGILLNLDRRMRRQLGVRRRKLKVLWEDRTAAEPAMPAADSREEVREWKQSLWGHVDHLPEAQRHALVLRFGAELPYEQIAQVMDCPLGTIKSRIFHGLAGVRRRLQEETAAGPKIVNLPTEGQNHAI